MSRKFNEVSSEPMSEKSPKDRTTKKNHGWFRRNAPKAVIIIVAIVALTLITTLPERDRNAAPTEAVPVNVEVMTVEAEPEFAETFDLPAVVEPNRIVTISAEVDGRIERIPLTEGSRVEPNEILIQLNTDLIQPQKKVAEEQVKLDQI